MKRLPLFDKKNEKIIIEGRCTSIAKALIDYYPAENKIGYMDGLAGISCFFFHYYRYSGCKLYESHAYNALEKVIHEIEKGFSDPSFAGGLSGVQWVLQYLGKMGFIDQSEASILDGLNPMFYAFSQEQFSRGKYDYLHGALGTFMPHLNNTPNTEFTLQEYSIELNSLIKGELSRLSKKHLDNSVFWESQDYLTGQKEINLGLAHGIPHILLVLSNIFRSNGDKEVLTDLIEPGIEFLQKFSKKNINSVSRFPTRIIDGKGIWPSRMAWCYGDPGAGLALLQIGGNCSRPDWKSLGLEILKSASRRRKRENSLVTDAGLCHGSSGLALIYYYAGLESDFEPLFETSQFWAKKTLNYGKQFHPRFNLLEGITGEGLFLIAMLEGEKPGWAEGLLLQ